MSRFRNLILALAFLSLPIALFYAQRRVPSFVESVSSKIMGGSYRIQEVLLDMASSVSERVYRIWAALDAQDEVIQLRAAKDQLRSLQITARELLYENQRLRELAGFAGSVEGPRKLGAQVIGRLGAPLTESIQIDVGSAQGVTRGDAVIGKGGAVGQVLMTARHHSDVLLVTDTSSAIDVLVQRTRAHGMVRGVSGASAYKLKVNDFDRLHDIVVGDIIVTSGVGARFPVGVLVGEVTSVRFPEEGLYIEADIKPFSDFEKLEEVVVLTKGAADSPWKRNELLMEQLEQSVGGIFGQGV